MLSIFNKNVVFQYKLAVMLTETRELHLGKMRGRFARKANKILREASVSGINRNTSSRSTCGRNSINNSRSSIANRSRSSSNISVVTRLAIILIILLRAENSRRFRNFRILGKEFRDTTVAWRCRYHTLVRKRVSWNSCVCVTFVRTKWLRRFIVWFGGSNAWTGRPIVSFSMRLNSRKHIGTHEFGAGGINIAKDFIVPVFNVATPAELEGISNRLMREDA